MSQAQMSVSADDWFVIKEKLQSEVLTATIVVGKRADGTKRKMNESFVLLMAVCNLPGGTFAEQNFADINMEKLSLDEQQTLAEAWRELDKDLWMEAQQKVYSMIIEKVPGKLDIKNGFRQMSFIVDRCCFNYCHIRLRWKWLIQPHKFNVSLMML